MLFRLIHDNMKGANIGEFEELVLLVAGTLYDDAYGLAIMNELEAKTGRSVMISAVHKALVRLEEKGFLKSRLGGATETRGGRDKRLYTLTPSAVKVIRQSRETRNELWSQIPKIVLQGGKI